MQKYFILFLFILNIHHLAFADTDKNCAGKIIVGRAEKIMLMENHLLIAAKIDTGAEMSSLSATHININHKNGHAIVQFHILGPHHKTMVLTKPLVRFVKIRKRAEENSHDAIRPVVNFMVCLANRPQQLEINLVDRSSFQYAMLIGRDVLKRLNALVDVNKEFQLETNC